MSLALLEQRLADYGSGGYYLLETFVLELLRLEAKSHGQVIQVEEKSIGTWRDAYAPNGLGDIAGPVSIEVTRALSPRNLDSILQRFRVFMRTNDESLLIVSVSGFLCKRRVG